MRMRKNKALTENKKLQIAEHYDKGELSVGAISENLGVSLRSVHNYKNYGETINPTTIQVEENDESLTEEEETDLQIYEMIHSGYTDSEIAQEVGISEDTVRNYRGDQKDVSEKNSEDIREEPKRINFVGGKKHKTEEPEKEEFEHECAECGHEFNGESSNCPGCGIKFGKEGNSENKESIDLGKIALAVGGIATVGYLIHRARSNKQNWPQSAWNDQEPPWINRVLNNQNQVI